MSIVELEDIQDISGKALNKLILVSIVCLIFMIGEFFGGFLANSLAILTDATHLLSDLTGFLISIFSIWIGRKRASITMSYGYHRAEVIGALASVILIWGLTLVLIYEAVIRL